MLFAEDNGREEWSVEIRLYGVRLCFLVSVVITRVLSVNSDAAGRCLKMRQVLSKNELNMLKLININKTPAFFKIQSYFNQHVKGTLQCMTFCCAIM